MTLLVLAAGMGSRYGGLKQLDPMTEHGEFIIDFSIYDAIRAGYNKVVFVIKKENYDAFRDTIGKRIEKVIDVKYVFQEMSNIPAHASVPAERVKPLGTAHALLAARDVINEKFSVINADDYYGPNAYKMAADYLSSVGEGHFCMIGYVLKNTLTDHGTVSRGICVEKGDGMLESITERTKIRHASDGKCAEYADGDTWVPLPYDSIVSMNFFGYDPSVFAFAEEGLARFLKNPETDLIKGEYYLPTMTSEMMAAGKCDLRVLTTTDEWHGVTYLEDKAEVVACIERLVSDGVYPDGLWKNN
ncbi:MAG: nucleotidyltransferase [Clostridia bacterium]|nr:nucleotidyltransferase [Clostridia bacterium]